MGSEVIANIDGRKVTVWNSASSGKPSDERVRTSVDEALAALAAYAGTEREEHP